MAGQVFERERNREFPFGTKPCPTSTPNLSNDITGPALTSMTPRDADPHGAGPRKDFQIAPSARPPSGDMGSPVRGSGVLNADPHPPTPAAQVQQANTYFPPHRR
jgi:hypothetical protein